MDPNKKPVVLVADDDPEILSLLKIRLIRAGYEVVAVADGDQVLAQVRLTKPDVLVLDVMMPGRNGWEVAKELREQPDFNDVGILMLTAIGERVNEMTSPLYGADDFVDKPFEFADLESRIRKVLTQRKEKK